MFKSLNIGLKLIFSVAAVVVIGLVILISLITKQVSQNITKKYRRYSCFYHERICYSNSRNFWGNDRFK